ncbi:MAG TPA: FCD domain-containing protein [Solirubrobacteraceae bacterium]|nr:FCD domain-containing protein [Solirubrobacteraceae bacterium]
MAPARSPRNGPPLTASFTTSCSAHRPAPRLRDLADRLRDTSELYRRWSGTLTTNLPPRDIPDEHRALMQAVLDHNADGAVTLITDHINRTASLLELYAAEAPEPASYAASGGRAPRRLTTAGPET